MLAVIGRMKYDCTPHPHHVEIVNREECHLHCGKYRFWYLVCGTWYNNGTTTPFYGADGTRHTIAMSSKGATWIRREI